jgi:hypothetical protein
MICIEFTALHKYIISIDEGKARHPAPILVSEGPAATRWLSAEIR